MSSILRFPDQRRNASPKPKMVRFSTMSELAFFERTKDEDKHKMHYSAKDYQAMQDDIKRSVQDARWRLSSLSSMSPESEQGDLDILVTGIENLVTPGVIKKLFASRVHHVRAVLGEQARQARHGEYDPSKLASVSRIHTEWTYKRACTIGVLQHRSTKQEPGAY